MPDNKTKKNHWTHPELILMNHMKLITGVTNLIAPNPN